jgi:hypothetical protein
MGIRVIFSSHTILRWTNVPFVPSLASKSVNFWIYCYFVEEVMTAECNWGTCGLQQMVARLGLKCVRKHNGKV